MTNDAVVDRGRMTVSLDGETFKIQLLEGIRDAGPEGAISVWLRGGELGAVWQSTHGFVIYPADGMPRCVNDLVLRIGAAWFGGWKDERVEFEFDALQEQLWNGSAEELRSANSMRVHALGIAFAANDVCKIVERISPDVSLERAAFVGALGDALAHMAMAARAANMTLSDVAKAALASRTPSDSPQVPTVEGWTGRKCSVCNGQGEDDDGHSCADCAGTGDEYGNVDATRGTP